jgi:threonine dehydrogenase-like Zn-dependent dehydrogenase
MRANCWHGKRDMRVEQVPDPKILNQRDAIVKITSTAICGSDLHLYNGLIPTVEKGDILGHEFMGEVVEVGREVKNLNVGDRVVVPFPIACGNCSACNAQAYSLCENSNPNAWMAEKMMGHSPAGIFGYSHMLGGFAGGQAEYARVPFADVGPLKVPDGIPDDKVLFLSDIFPTGYMDRSLGLWARRPIRDCERQTPRRGTGHRYRSVSGEASNGAGKSRRDRYDRLRGARRI